MLNIFIQILTLFSGLLINFLIPLLFGIEEYGIFIKANILVFLFQKLMDVISEPLISNVDKNQLFPVAFAVGIFLLSIFLTIDYFFSAGSPWLLSSMFWSNCILLVLYALNLRKLVLIYLIFFIIIFTTLLLSVLFKITELSITNVCGITNFIPSTCCLFFLLYTRQMPLSFNGFHTNIMRMILLIPRLFSLTLVNNLFTNILPFYLSFIFPPQLLGLFRIQVSIVQSVVAIFPINSKVLSTYFLAMKGQNDFLEKLLACSINYFYIIALLGYLCVGFYDARGEFCSIFLLLPVVHASLILERYMLGMSMRRALMAINLVISLLACVAVTYVHTIAQMVLLYASGLSLYLFCMLLFTSTFQFKFIVRLMTLITPVTVLLAINSFNLGLSIAISSAVVVLIFAPLNRKSLSILMR